MMPIPTRATGDSPTERRPAQLERRRSNANSRPIRLLAVSDEVERAFDFEANRDALTPIDAILGAGDLKPEYLDFLANAFSVPLLYVLGNHDRGGGWNEEKHHVPEPMDGAWHDVAEACASPACRGRRTRASGRSTTRTPRGGRSRPGTCACAAGGPTSWSATFRRSASVTPRTTTITAALRPIAG